MLALALAFLSAPACDDTRQTDVLCEQVCECLEFFPSDQRACQIECEASFAEQLEPDACFDCLESATCREITRGTCEPSCF